MRLPGRRQESTPAWISRTGSGTAILSRRGSRDPAGTHSFWARTGPPTRAPAHYVPVPDDTGPRLPGRTIHTAPPAIAFLDVSGLLGVCGGRGRYSPGSCVSVSGGADSSGGGLVLLGPVPRPGAAGGRVQVAGAGDAPAACGLDPGGPGDEQPAARAAAGVELSGFDPVVDDAGAAAQPEGGLGDADLAVGGGRRRGGGRAGAGSAAQVCGLPDPGAAAGLDLIVPGDANPVARAAAGGQLPGAEPVVDDAGAAAQPDSGLGHADLAVGIRVRGRDLAGVTDPLDGLDIERPAVACGQPGCVQVPDQVVVAGGRAEAGDELDRGIRGAPGRARMDGPSGGELVGGAGVPADADAHLVGPLLGEQGDVGDQGAQQPFAVFGAGSRGVPEGGQVGGEFLQLRVAGQWRQRVVSGFECVLSFGESGEFRLPPCLQAPCDQPVFGLDGAEGALGPVGVVAGAFHRESGGPADPLVPAGDLVGG